MRVLLVEDRIDVRDLFEHVLASRGHEVTACADGGAAWHAYGERPYEPRAARLGIAWEPDRWASALSGNPIEPRGRSLCHRHDYGA